MSSSHDSVVPASSRDAESGKADSTAVKRASKIAVMVVIAFAVLGARAIWDRSAHANALEKTASESAQQYVTAVKPKAGPADQTVKLPGTLMGVTESPIYARSTGYIAHWYKDIGDTVKQGDLLATVDTPEIDRELSAAEATREQVKARLDLAGISAKRWQKLRSDDAVSQEELDERQSALTQSQADLDAANAEVGRLQELERFKSIVAPFAGVITRRNIDIGALVDAGSEGAGKELFMLAKTDVLKTYVYVPEAYSQRVKNGDRVRVTLNELPGKNFYGTVVRTADAIDTVTRSMQIEVDLPNPDGVLKPGAYADVQLDLPSSDAVVIPANTLLFRAEGLRVAVIDPNGQVHLKPVTVGEDYGTTLQITQGVNATDRLVLNPPDSLEDGQHVSVR
ncbi:efflux RND transporter periplasmic adaptor subunit [Paraburkholderia phenazinium]|uniref:RND family efflux transporter, MFP subunit n=1 Tax=Paraburkholderia phenazinium TaxID=60549 RepID=A0A1N6JPV2_9BURK|nr:efflux RND transporter periplasmic adaptor subunit [Paraburkholderia phenazinium]SIO46424.1 RND family efflux transporter, MFP subunit [Paraburkholderia phenazinium]